MRRWRASCQGAMFAAGCAMARSSGLLILDPRFAAAGLGGLALGTTSAHCDEPVGGARLAAGFGVKPEGVDAECAGLSLFRRTTRGWSKRSPGSRSGADLLPLKERGVYPRSADPAFPSAVSNPPTPLLGPPADATKTARCGSAGGDLLGGRPCELHLEPSSAQAQMPSSFSTDFAEAPPREHQNSGCTSAMPASGRSGRQLFLRDGWRRLPGAPEDGVG